MLSFSYKKLTVFFEIPMIGTRNLNTTQLQVKRCFFISQSHASNPFVQYDVHLCGYSALLKIVAKFHDEVFSDPSSPTGLNKAG